jgi:EmrB/QacA subfamily drug resistance transporter
MTLSPRSTLSQRDIYRVLSGVLLGMFLSALDQSIVATALPAMGHALGGFRELSWIVSVYLLTSTASTPIYGRLSDLYGRRVMLLAAIAIFITSSALCGFAGNMPQIVAARALQGLGGGGLLSMAQSTIADIIAPRERGRYQAYFSGTYAIATVGGPVLGGIVVDHLSWSWVFWINPPLGVIAFLLCRRALRLLPVPHVKREIDYLGAGLLMATVGCWLFILTSGGKTLPWFSPGMAGLVAAGLVLVAALIYQELRVAEPIVPPHLFRIHFVRQAWLASFLITMGQLSTAVLMPSFLQLVLGVTPGQSGLLILPFMVGTVFGSFNAGRLMRRTGHYKRMALGAICLAIFAQLLLAYEAEAMSLPLIEIGLLLTGLGFGPTFPAMMVSGQNGAELKDLGIVTSMIAFFRTLGGSFGIAIMWSVLLTTLAATLGADHAHFLGSTIMNRVQGGTLPEAARELLVPALAASFRLVFLVTAGLCAAAAVVLALTREKPLRDQSAYDLRQRAAE